MILLALGLVIGPLQSDSLLWRAESLLAHGKLAEARRIVERLEARRPNDPAVLTMLGRIHLAWPVVGRYQAESLLSRAARLDPANPEPLYYIGQVGYLLGGDDGEQIARRGLVPAIALNPDYRDAWQLWLKLYRGDRERRAMIRALEVHRGNGNADLHRAQLLVELGQYDEARALLESLIERRPADPVARAWQARALFGAGMDEAGSAVYEQALRLAEFDSGRVLWDQLRGIASPAERATYAMTAPAERAAFLRRFWARREPDLSTPVNERLGEHFRRLDEAEGMFALLHPNSRYFRSPLFRTLSGGLGRLPGPGIEAAYAKARDAQCEARLPSVTDEPVQQGYAPRMDPTAGAMPNLEDDLDDRGRVFLRHGRPDYRLVHNLDAETWCYFRPDGSVLRVSFLRRTSGYGAAGDMVVTPMMSGEAESARQLLATDRFSTTSDLTFAYWPAAFRAGDRRSTELLVIPDSVRAVAVLVDRDGLEIARDSGTDRALHLLAPPGSYLLLLDAARGRHTGRYRGSIPLPDFGGETPTVSSILLAPGDVAPDRDSLAAHAPHGLTMPATQPLRVYAELYNLGRVSGLSRWRAEYRFERLDGSIVPGGRNRTLTIAFDREQLFSSRIVESLVIDPDRLPPGRYRLHLEITDQLLDIHTSSALIEFRLR